MAQGWNFGEVILQAIEAQKNRNFQAVAMEREMTFRDAQARRAFDEAKQMEDKQQAGRESLQKGEHGERWKELVERGNQELEQLRRRGDIEKDNILLNQQPVSAEELEAKYKGTPLQGKFKAHANEKGMVTYNDRALLLGTYLQEKDMAKEDARFNAQMQMAQEDSKRNFELYRTARKQGEYQYAEVPEVRSAIGERAGGFLDAALGVSPIGIALNVASGRGAFTGFGAGIDRMKNAAATEEADRRAVRSATANNMEVSYQRGQYLPEVDRVMERYKHVPLTVGTTAAADLGKPYTQELSLQNPTAPALPGLLNFYQYAASPLYMANMQAEARLMEIAKRTEGAVEVQNAKK